MSIFSKPAARAPEPVAPSYPCRAESQGAESSEVQMCGAPATHLIRVVEQTHDSVERFIAQQPEATFTHFVMFCDAHYAAYERTLRDSRTFARIPAEAFQEHLQQTGDNLVDALVEVFDATDKQIARVTEYLARQRLIIRLPPLRVRGEVRSL